MIIFDCDGVLVDSEMISNRFHAQALTRLGYPISIEETAKRFIGVDSHTVRAIISSEANVKLPEKIGDLDKEELLAAYKTELKPLIFDFVKSVADRNIPRCIVSNNSREKVLHALECTNQLQFFKEEYIFTEAQVARGKPDPALFFLAAKTLKQSHKDCIVIEDSRAGIQGALTAEMKVIGFLGGSHAQYPWYQERIKAFDVPVAHNLIELENMVKLHSIYA